MKHEMNRRLSLGLCIEAPRSNRVRSRRPSDHIAMNIAAVCACIILFAILLLIASY